MRIALLFNQDIHANRALNLLAPQIRQHKLGFFTSSHVGNKQTRHAELEKLYFSEQTLFNEHLFPALEHARKRAAQLTFNQIAEDFNTSIVNLDDVNTLSGHAKMRAFKPDLMISIRFGKILKDEAINIPSKGVINLHSGILPNYRGVMATFWALKKNETEIGTTLHWISDSGIDTGRIISISKQKVASTSYFAQVQSLYEPGVKQIIQAINTLEDGETLPEIAPTGEEHYYSFPLDGDIDAFLSSGQSLINDTDRLHMTQSFS